MPTPLSQIITAETGVRKLPKLLSIDFFIDADSLETINMISEKQMNSTKDRDTVARHDYSAHIAIVSSYMLNNLAVNPEYSELNELFDKYRKIQIKCNRKGLGETAYRATIMWKKESQTAKRMRSHQSFNQWLQTYKKIDDQLKSQIYDSLNAWHQMFVPSFPNGENKSVEEYTAAKTDWELSHKEEWLKTLHMDGQAIHNFGYARGSLINGIIMAI